MATDDDNQGEIIRAPTFLKAKVGEMAQRLPKDVAESLDGQIDSMRSVYLEMFDEDVATIRGFVAAAPGPLVNADMKDGVYPILHRIRGEAGMNGLDSAATVADALCNVFEENAHEGRVPVALVKLHVDALAAIRRSPDDSKACKGIVSGLALARDKLLSV
jgi:hypothetical protein